VPRAPSRIVQIAYHVEDPARAAAEFAAEYGWGPFFLFEHIPLAACRYRGEPASFDHTSAYGQAGDVMVELLCQHDDAPSCVRERYSREATGLHHVAHFVDDLSAAITVTEAHGGGIVMDATTADGVRFVMVERPRLGHLVELYEPREALSRFYAYVRKKSLGWDGSDPVRRLGL